MLKWDSWDLTLAQIFQWYTDNSDMATICNHGALEHLFTYAKIKNRLFSIVKHGYNYLEHGKIL